MIRRHTLWSWTELSYVRSTGIVPTAFGTRVEPVNEVVYPRGCWNGEIGSRTKNLNLVCKYVHWIREKYSVWHVTSLLLGLVTPQHEHRYMHFTRLNTNTNKSWSLGSPLHQGTQKKLSLFGLCFSQFFQLLSSANHTTLFLTFQIHSCKLSFRPTGRKQIPWLMWPGAKCADNWEITLNLSLPLSLLTPPSVPLFDAESCVSFNH